MKECITCHQLYPHTLEHFETKRNQCRTCVKTLKKAYNKIYNSTPERKAVLRAHAQKPEYKAKKKEFGAKYRKTDARKQTIEKHWAKPETKARAAKRAKRPDVIAKQNAYVATPAGKASRKRAQQNYRKTPEGHEKTRVRTQSRRAKIRALPVEFNSTDWEKALLYFGGCCAVCGRCPDESCTLAQDHWIPISKKGAYVRENIVPLCHGVRGCNNSKADKDAHEWLVSRYGEDKAMMIEMRVSEFLNKETR